MLGGVRISHFPLVPMNKLNKTESAVFLDCRCSPFHQIILSFFLLKWLQTSLTDLKNTKEVKFCLGVYF